MLLAMCKTELFTNDKIPFRTLVYIYIYIYIGIYLTGFVKRLLEICTPIALISL